MLDQGEDELCRDRRVDGAPAQPDDLRCRAAGVGIGGRHQEAPGALARGRGSGEKAGGEGEAGDDSRRAAGKHEVRCSGFSKSHQSA